MTTPQSAKPTAPYPQGARHIRRAAKPPTAMLLTRGAKGAFARRLVIYCVTILTAAGIWAAVVKTIDHSADLSDVLTFLGAAFGGELLLLLVKRVFAKDGNAEDD